MSTKGEWKSVGWAVKDVEGKTICDLTQNYNRKADAHLIASAPRMREFIQRLADNGNIEAQEFLQSLA